MSATESSSFVVAPATGLFIWTVLVYTYAAVLVSLFVVMYRRMDSDFKSPESERINERMSWAMRVGLGCGIFINALSDDATLSGIAIVVPAMLVLGRCAVYVWARNPRSSQRPAELAE